MIIDSSALLAILFQEEDAADFAQALADDMMSVMSAANYLETAIRIDQSPYIQPRHKLDLLIQLKNIEIAPVTYGQAQIAREAYRQYGKGNHPARLNYGDCFAYALARDLGETLLCKGNDFSQTDIRVHFPA